MVIVVSTISCENKQERKDADAIGKYLYIDAFHRLHVRKNCWRIGDVVEFLDTASLYAKDNFKYCTECFTDSAYEHVQSIIHYDVERKWLYEKLKEAYNDIPSYQIFIKNLHDPKNIKLIYDAACSQGLDVGTFDDFSKSIESND